MSQRARPIERTAGPITVSATLPENNAGNAVIELSGALGAILECTAASASPAGTIEVQFHKDGDWFQWACWEFASGVATPRAAGATITLADNDAIIVETPFHAVRFKRASGTSAVVYWRTCETVHEILVALGAVSSRDGQLTIDLTPTIDTAAYAAGDTFFDTVAVPLSVPTLDGYAYLNGVTVIDKDDEKATLRLLGLDANVSLGTINIAPSITDANAASFMYDVGITPAEYIDLGGVSVAYVPLTPRQTKGAAASQSAYFAAMIGEAHTYTTAADVVLRFHYGPR